MEGTVISLVRVGETWDYIVAVPEGLWKAGRDAGKKTEDEFVK